MDPTRQIKARVGAARLLLEQQVAGSAMHVSVSRLQAAAIVELLGQSSLSSQALTHTHTHNKQTNKQANKQTNTQAGKQTNTQTNNKQTNKQTRPGPT
jgi:hypothetical protein